MSNCDQLKKHVGILDKLLKYFSYMIIIQFNFLDPLDNMRFKNH